MGFGNPMSTQTYCRLSFDFVMSVNSFNKSLSCLTPSLESVLHSGRSYTFRGFPVAYSARICTCSEFLILHIVDVDSLFLPLKILFPRSLFINVDFPEFVSPAKGDVLNISIYVKNIMKNISGVYNEYVFFIYMLQTKTLSTCKCNTPP